MAASGRCVDFRNGALYQEHYTAYLNQKYPDMHEIPMTGIYLGSENANGATNADKAWAALKARNVKYIVNCVDASQTLATMGATYLNIAVPKTHSAKNVVIFKDQLAAVTAFIRQSLAAGGRVLVFDRDGSTRASCVVIGYLMGARSITYEQAYTLVERQRAFLDPSMELFLADEFKPADLWPSARGGRPDLRMSGTPAEMRLMSFNVNYGLGRGRKGTQCCDAIVSDDPDVCVLQETTEEWEQKFENTGLTGSEGRYRHTLYRHAAKAGGSAILSKFPIHELHWAPSPTGWFNVMIVRVDHPDPRIGSFQIMNLHMRPPLDAGREQDEETNHANDTSRVSVWSFFSSKGDRLTDLQQWVTLLDPALPSIVMGDMNECTGGVHHGYCGRFLEDNGYRNAIAEFDPDTPTWHWPLRFMTMRAHFDHIFYPPTQFLALTAKVIQEGASDHYPVVATLVPTASHAAVAADLDATGGSRGE